MNKKILLFIIAFSVLIQLTFALELPPGVQKLIEYQQELAQSVTFIIAFLAGIISLTSPCGFVLLPTFFTFLFKERKKAVLMTIAFGIGLILAFIIFGLVAGFVGVFFNIYKEGFAFFSGFILLIFAALMFLNKGFGFFNFKVDHLQKKSFFSIASLGLLFGIGWTPCIGPVLGGIFILAANQANVLKSVFLLLFYALGAIVPLIILAYLTDRYDLANKNWIRGRLIEFSLFGKKIYTHTYNIISATILFLLGILLIFQNGTYIFMKKIPEYLPWSMGIFYQLNEFFLESKKISSVIGIVFLIAIVFLIIRAIKSNFSQKQ